MRRPDAIITDLDGTLLGPDKTIGEQDKATIRRLRELGVPVIPGTGRPIFGLGWQAEEMGLRLALCSNGGCCYDYDREEVLFARTIPHDAVRRLIDWGMERRIKCMLHAPKSVYRSPGAEVFSHYVLPEEEKRFISPGMSLEGVDVLKVLFFDCDEVRAIGELRGIFPESELAICSSGSGLVDINPPGVGKGTGVRQLAELRGWRMENLLAMGDNYNDRTMLEAVGMSAVPASGQEDIKAMAAFVTTPCGENPLTAAVRHFCPGLLEEL